MLGGARRDEAGTRIGSRLFESFFLFFIFLLDFGGVSSFPGSFQESIIDRSHDHFGAN